LIVEFWVVTPCAPFPRFSWLRKFEGHPTNKNTSLGKIGRVFEPSRMMFKEMKGEKKNS